MISSTIFVLMLFSIPASPYLGSWGYPVLLTAMIISGFCRGYNILPTLVVNCEFDAAGEDAFKVNLWQSIDTYGEVIAFVTSGIMMNNFHWDWKVVVIINIFCFFAVALALYCTADEINMSKSNGDDGAEIKLSESIQEIK